ncbi:MAG: DUF1802 family protein [Planctomycetes bacterium]|nr:DUF1802 family protein [Planctomycetota bacterium]
MLPASNMILKEWASVCQALRTGRQSILLRKGGIAEGPRGFSIEHDEFWLWPTYLHQSAEGLASDAADLFDAAQRQQPPAGRAHMSLYAVVERVWLIDDATRLPLLRPFHVLSGATIESRFHYRRPGLYVAAVQVFESPTPFVAEEDEQLAGCKSWGQLPTPLSTDGLRPIDGSRHATDLAKLTLALGE